jgi:hypothetical protein
MDTGPPTFAMHLVHASKQPIHPNERLVDNLAYRAQGMLVWDKVFKAVQCEWAFGEGVGPAHGWAGFVCGQQKELPRIIG